ncbi:MAG: molybdenum ABC transporter ATP-binding protein [Acidobacteria bacterium]|nr:MAG: molybdenum ABC transporter ATP-binding protein [Acidobacteriota bacterium]
MSYIEIDLALSQGSFTLAVAAGLGETAAVLGPSGAGKTTLLEVIAGLRRARGRLVVGGEVLQDSTAGIFLPPERRHLGFVPQDGALFPHRPVLANLGFGRPDRRARRDAELDALVAALDLEPLLALLLLDEPTAGLDPERARKALAGVLRVRGELGVPLLVVTHDQREALALAADVVLLDRGRVEAVGPAREVLRAPWRLALDGGGPWENVVPGRLLGHNVAGGTSEVRLETGETVTIPHTPDLAPGAEILLTIDAEDLLLATAPPRGLSARNAVAGTIDELIPAGTSIYVRVGPWLAHLTPAAVKELGLAAGEPVWLVAKTHSWRVAAG